MYLSVVLVSCSWAMSFSFLLRSTAQIHWKQIIMTITLFTAMCVFLFESFFVDVARCRCISFVMLVISVFLRRVCLGLSKITFHLFFTWSIHIFRFGMKCVSCFINVVVFPLCLTLFLLLFNVFWEAFFLFLDVFCAFVFLISAVSLHQQGCPAGSCEAFTKRR